jgi:hypothetical protein
MQGRAYTPFIPESHERLSQKIRAPTKAQFAFGQIIAASCEGYTGPQAPFIY